MPYPIDVSTSGEVGRRDDCHTFPDTRARIEGTTSAMIPEKLTT